MPSYIHYERFCGTCKRYFENRLNSCPLCEGKVKPINKWYVTFRAEDCGKIKQKKLGAFLSKSACEKAYAEYILQSHDHKQAEGYGFLSLVADVLARQKSENKSATYLAYSNIYYNRLTELHRLNVEDITERQLRTVYDKIKASSQSMYTKRATWSALGHALNYASLRKGIDEPFRAYKLIKPFSPTLNKKQSWTAEEAHKFLNTIRELSLTATTEKERQTHYIYYVLFSYMYYMANRRGEVLALKVKKIDFEKGYVTIDENITNKLLPEERAKGLTYKTTDRKNHKAIIEAMPRAIEDILKEYIQSMKLKKNDYLFFGKSPIPPQTIKHRMDAYIKLADVPRITPHQFRHTHASIVFASGNSKIEDAYVVAQRLGHDVKYTLEVYGSLYKEREKDIIDNINF